MSNSDYLPKKDGDLVPWTDNFIQVASANLEAIGLEPEDLTQLTQLKSVYSTGLSTAIAKAADAKSATEAKNAKKQSLSTDIRVLAKQIQASPKVNDSLRVQLGLKPSVPTPAPIGPFPPTSLTYEVISERTITLRWSRNGNSPTTIFIIEASGSADADFIMIGTSSKLSFETSYRSAKEQTYYRVRAQRGDVISEPSNVTVI